jgi:hypothetical protein
MFESTLSTIDATPQQLEQLRGLNAKYRSRFTVMHKRKLEEYRKIQDSLSSSTSKLYSSSIDPHNDKSRGSAMTNEVTEVKKSEKKK